MNKIGVIMEINIKSAILIMNNFGAKNCTLPTFGVVWNLHHQSYSDRYNLVVLGKNAQPTLPVSENQDER